MCVTPRTVMVMRMIVNQLNGVNETQFKALHPTVFGMIAAP